MTWTKFSNNKTKPTWLKDFPFDVLYVERDVDSAKKLFKSTFPSTSEHLNVIEENTPPAITNTLEYIDENNLEVFIMSDELIRELFGK